MPIAKSLLFASLALVAGAVHAQESQESLPLGEVALSNETLQLRYIDDSDRVSDGSRASAGFFLSEERDIVMTGDVLFPAQLDFDRLQIHFGLAPMQPCSKTRTTTCWP